MRGGGRTGRGRGRSRSNPCRIHAGQHDWYDCWDNANSPNYRPNRQAGRGGRGRQQNWRGGRGFGRHNYHNNGGRNNYQQNHHNDPNKYQNQQQSYHNEQYRQQTMPNSSMSAITNESQNPARGAPSSVYAGDLHQYDLIPNENGSAWSTGNYHSMNQYGRRY